MTIKNKEIKNRKLVSTYRGGHALIYGKFLFLLLFIPVLLL